MAEKTLNEALSGGEIKEIIRQVIEKSLNGDCTLNDDLAYAGFTVKYEIKVSYLRSLTPPTLVWGTANSIPEGTSEPAGDTSISATHTSAPSPDIERQSHDLPIPVLVQTPNGPQRQKVRVERVKK